MKYCSIDINFTKNGIADCFIASIHDGNNEVAVKKRCKLDASGIRTLDGAAPFEFMDSIDVQLSDGNWAIVDAL